MSAVNSQHVQWSTLLDINNVTPYGPDDEACFREVRDVLMKHGALERFGLQLLHKHFELNNDEVMVEFTDIEKRELITKPVKKSEASNYDPIITSWKLADGDIIAETHCTCGRTHQGHNGGHMSV